MRFVLLAVLAVAACSKKATDEGPSCDKVVDNILTITKTQLAGHGDMEMGNKKQMVDQCEQRKLTGAQRTCMAAAKDLNGLAACTPRPAAPQ